MTFINIIDMNEYEYIYKICIYILLLFIWGTSYNNGSLIAYTFKISIQYFCNGDQLLFCYVAGIEFQYTTLQFIYGYNTTYISNKLKILMLYGLRTYTIRTYYKPCSQRLI